MPTLRCFDLLGNLIGGKIDTCAEVYSRLADQMAERFAVEVDRIAFDNRDDGVTYLTVNGEARGYVLTIDPDGGWHEAIPFGGNRKVFATGGNPPPLKMPTITQDNDDTFTPRAPKLVTEREFI